MRPGIWPERWTVAFPLDKLGKTRVEGLFVGCQVPVPQGQGPAPHGFPGMAGWEAWVGTLGH